MKRVELILDEPFTPSVTTGSEFDFREFLNRQVFSGSCVTICSPLSSSPLTISQIAITGTIGYIGADGNLVIGTIG